MKYIVRINCEYSMVVEAESPLQAKEDADHTPLGSGKWEEAWSTYEVDEEEEA